MKKPIIIVCTIILYTILSILPNVIKAFALTDSIPTTKLRNSLIAQEIERLLNSNQIGYLNFPKTVKRLYVRNDLRPVWIKAQSGEGPTWQAMMLLDCVLQYGLSASDYHPDELIYSKMHHALDTIGRTGINETARLDILLSDAMISLMNHLHYGKLNPRYLSAMIDDDQFKGFHSDSAVLRALKENHPFEFWKNVERVQPQTKPYQDLQQRMRLMEGQYTGDSYQPSDLKTMEIAINLEPEMAACEFRNVPTGKPAGFLPDISC